MVLVHIDAACRRVASDIINPTAFTVTGGNPSSDLVKGLMKDLDIPDFFRSVHSKFIKRWRKSEAYTFISDKLDEIVNRRHVVAHTATALNIARNQLNESVRFLKILASVIDSELTVRIAEIVRASKSP